MLSDFFLYAGLAGLLFVIKELVTTVLRNRRAHQFFKERSPNLPVVSNISIFGGHTYNLIWARKNWRKFLDLHKKYGKTAAVFYCDKPCVSTLDLDFIKAMVFDKPNDHVDRIKSNTPVEELEHDCIFSAENKQWRKIRRSVAPAFTKTKFMMPSVQAEIEAVIEKLIDSFENKLNQAKLDKSENYVTLNFDEVSLRYTNALVLSCFYKQDKVIDFNSANDRFTEMIDSSMKNSINMAFKFCIMFPVVIPIINWLLKFHPLGLMRTQLMSFIKQQTLNNLQARQQIKKVRQTFEANNEASDGRIFNPDNFVLDDGSKFRRNMVDYIIDQFHDGKLTQSEYLNSTFFLFLAASTTSADAISKLTYHLAAHQDEQEKLRASIAVDGVDSEYLHWSIFESLRLFPPGPLGCSRTLSYDMKTSDNINIPAGTFVFTSPHIINRLKEYWGPDADEYKPERWRQSSSFHPVQFLTFGAGKRNCFGGQFAVNEIKLLMSKLLSRYKFKLAPDTNSTTIMEFDTFFVFASSDLPTNIEVSRLCG